MIKDIIINLHRENLPYTPVLFNNIKRSLQLLRRLLHRYPQGSIFTSSVIRKMMSSQKRATSEEVTDWLDFLSQKYLFEVREKYGSNTKRQYRTSGYAMKVKSGLL
ncbi:hypothetical protein NEMIN01_1084 [Nematocida minor]|uniref:uncharacterized protein n=1 Tax=Nematocida minor TaxID=1912983 RepID=UPI002220342E|nr:uncharacterized protein NEMIN01_1084 [Nematocida minor]KAI5190546.1 hypothetical protein NEMIN01_1084 [Nematocida minor]